MGLLPKKICLQRPQGSSAVDMRVKCVLEFVSAVSDGAIAATSAYNYLALI